MPQQPGSRPSPAAISARDLRPRRLWYLVAVGVFCVCVAIGGVLFAVQIGDVADGVNLQKLRDFTRVTLTAEKPQAIYATGRVDNRSTPRCVQRGPGRLKVSSVRTTEHYTVGGTKWTVVGILEATESGTYRVRCQAAGATGMAIGNRIGGVLAGGLGAVATFAGSIFFGVLTGGITALVTLLRRNGHKRRLLRSAAGPSG